MPKKIMIVVPTLSSGGAERVATLWANNLAKCGNNVSVLTFYHLEREYSLDEQVNRLDLYPSKDDYKKEKYINRIIKIRKIIKGNKTQIVIPMVSYTGIIVNIACFFSKVKVIETIRNNPSKVPPNKLLRILRNISIYIANGCIFQNHAQKMFFKHYRKPSLVVPNPIDDQFLKAERTYRDHAVKACALGRLHQQKNYKLMIDAVYKVKEKRNIKLNIYGEGEEKNELVNYIKKKGLDNCIQLNDRTDKVLDVLLDNDIYILSSDYEGIPNTLLEAMASGMPCISTDCPTGPAEIIENTGNGLLVPMNNVDEMAKAIENMIVDYKTAIEMGKNAKKTTQKYNAKSIIESINSFIETF